MADNSIAALLANAGQTNADFDFGKLNKSYYQGLEEAYKKRTRDAFMGPDVLGPDGQLDPAKMLQKATQVGGLPAAEHLKSLYETGMLQERYKAGVQTHRDRFPDDTTTPPASPNAFPPSPSRDPAIVSEPKAPRTAPPQAQSTGPFTQFLTAQGIPAEQQQGEALKLQQGFMQLTGRPFDTTKQLNLADNDTRQVLGKYVLARAGQGQQPQASMATQVAGPPPGAAGPAGPQIGPGAAQAAQSPFAPQGAGPPQAAPPQAAPPQATAPQPVQPRPVQTVPIQRPDPVDQTLNAIVGPQELRRFGTWQNALAYYEKQLAVPSGLPAAMQADLEKKVAAMREQLKVTELQRNAAAAGQTVRQYQDAPEEAKQRQAVLEKIAPVLVDSSNQAFGARDGIQSIHRAKAQLDAPGGTITGLWADDRVKLLQFAELLGADSSKIANTQTFVSEMSRRIQQNASSLPGQLSDKDVKFLSSISGTSSLSESSLRRMLDIAEDVNRKKISLHKERLGQAAGTNEALGQYKSFLDVNQPDPYRRQLHEGDIIRNPTTNKQYIIKGGKPVAYP